MKEVLLNVHGVCIHFLHVAPSVAELDRQKSGVTHGGPAAAVGELYGGPAAAVDNSSSDPARTLQPIAAKVLMKGPARTRVKAELVNAIATMRTAKTRRAGAGDDKMRSRSARA